MYNGTFARKGCMIHDTTNMNPMGLGGANAYDILH
jgi:hypothetical protein